ncbi:hypothetical protein BD413DRAFT_86179 [Trametes elegans]|nr:hypothetical protein BD413DRAFT_86179 [Trametes elegans]
MKHTDRYSRQSIPSRRPNGGPAVPANAMQSSPAANHVPTRTRFTGQQASRGATVSRDSDQGKEPTVGAANLRACQYGAVRERRLSTLYRPRPSNRCVNPAHPCRQEAPARFRSEPSSDSRRGAEYVRSAS